jgi:hypothetical protein
MVRKSYQHQHINIIVLVKVAVAMTARTNETNPLLTAYLIPQSPSDVSLCFVNVAFALALSSSLCQGTRRGCGAERAGVDSKRKEIVVGRGLESIRATRFTNRCQQHSPKLDYVVQTVCCCCCPHRSICINKTHLFVRL